MDFKFKYDRHKPPPAVKRARERTEEDRLRLAKGLSYGLTIPFLMLSGPLSGWLLGSWLDRQFHWGFATILMILFGTAAGLKLVIDMLGRLSKG